ncbi:hypothetical protein ACLOJK_011340 [Asimina triloba]
MPIELFIASFVGAAIPNQSILQVAKMAHQVYIRLRTKNKKITPSSPCNGDDNANPIKEPHFSVAGCRANKPSDDADLRKKTNNPLWEG